MKKYQHDFIKFALDYGVLKFGEFTLKSGRISPYFFNAGMFSDGHAFQQLGNFYADVLHDYFNNKYDVLFGPAYKGISLATAASIGLQQKYNQNLAITFNRKEAKDHGEGGNLIGASLIDQRIVLIDDVITAGTTIRDSLQTINAVNGKLIGIVIALDRQEKGLNSNLSAIQEVEKEFGLQVNSIITLENLIEYLRSGELENADHYLSKIDEYRALYGIHTAL